MAILLSSIIRYNSILYIGRGPPPVCCQTIITHVRPHHYNRYTTAVFIILLLVFFFIFFSFCVIGGFFFFVVACVCYIHTITKLYYIYKLTNYNIGINMSIYVYPKFPDTIYSSRYWVYIDLPTLRLLAYEIYTSDIRETHILLYLSSLVYLYIYIHYYVFMYEYILLIEIKFTRKTKTR